MQNITEALVCSLFMVFVFAGAVSLRPYLPRIWSKSATSTSTTTPERSEKTSCCNARTRVRGILPMPLLCSQWLHSVGFPVYVLMSWSLYLSVLCVCVTSTMATVLKQACQVETFICYVCFTHLQERVLSCRRCLPNLLERSDKLARMFNRSSQLVCARAPSKNTPHYCAARSPRHLHIPKSFCGRGSAHEQG